MQQCITHFILMYMWTAAGHTELDNSSPRRWPITTTCGKIVLYSHYDHYQYSQDDWGIKCLKPSLFCTLKENVEALDADRLMKLESFKCFFIHATALGHCSRFWSVMVLRSHISIPALLVLDSSLCFASCVYFCQPPVLRWLIATRQCTICWFLSRYTLFVSTCFCNFCF